MKKIILLVILLLIPISVYARLAPDAEVFMTPEVTPSPPEPPESSESSPCTAHKITVDFLGDPDVHGKIQNIFTNYKSDPSYYNSDTRTFELCFEFTGFTTTDGYAKINRPLTFINSAANKNTLIKGLKIMPSSTFPHPAFLLTVVNPEFTSKIIIEDINLKGVRNGLEIQNRSFEDTWRMNLSKIIIEGDGSKLDAHACLKISNSQNVAIKKSEFHDCHTGILIDNSVSSLIGADSSENYNADKNIIAGNEFGIILQSGADNKYSYNNIFNNSGVDSPDYAIFIDPTLEIMRPEILLIDEENHWALHCSKDSSGRITERYLKFNPETVEVGREILIYETDSKWQAKKYNTKCTIEEGGICRLTSLQSPYAFNDNDCATMPEDLYTVALVNAPSHTSMLTSEYLQLRGPITAVGGVVSTVDVPSVPAGVTPISESTDVEEEVSGASFAGEPGSGPGGGCGGGASIVPPTMEHTIITSLGTWWIITAVSLAILCVVRIRKKK